MSASKEEVLEFLKANEGIKRHGDGSKVLKVVPINVSDGNITCYKIHFYGVKKPQVKPLENKATEQNKRAEENAKEAQPKAEQPKSPPKEDSKDN
jgi:hypothetical protein